MKRVEQLSYLSCRAFDFEGAITRPPEGRRESFWTSVSDSESESEELDELDESSDESDELELEDEPDEDSEDVDARRLRF
jgi:hypothetical protein